MFSSPVGRRPIGLRIIDGIGRVTVFILLPVLCHGFSTARHGGGGEMVAVKIRLQAGCVLVSPRKVGCFCDVRRRLVVGIADRDPGEALRLSAWRTIARIDRLNYRDIGVIKAPLCWDPFYEGVEVTRRDSTPGVRILAFSPSLFSIPSYDSRQGPSVTSPRSSATLC